jgi:hypothetical protein
MLRSSNAPPRSWKRQSKAASRLRRREQITISTHCGTSETTTSIFKIDLKPSTKARRPSKNVSSCLGATQKRHWSFGKTFCTLTGPLEDFARCSRQGFREATSASTSAGIPTLTRYKWASIFTKCWTTSSLQELKP